MKALYPVEDRVLLLVHLRRKILFMIFKLL